MNQGKQNKKLANLWISPLLAGSFFAIGYNIARKFDVFNAKDPNSLVSSFAIKRVFPGISLDSFTKEVSNTQLIEKPASGEGFGAFKTPNNTQTIITEETIKTNTKNAWNSENQKKIKNSKSRSNPSLDSLPIETQLFFKTHNIDEVIKKLPMP